MTDAPTSAPTSALTEPPTAPLVNDTIRTLLAHRTFRAYTAEPVSREAIETILTVALHGATSSFQQQVTVIRVQDPAVREQVHLASGQPYVGGERGELFVFVVDLHRNAVLRERAGADLEPLERTSLFLQGVEDTMIAAQNAVVAAESLGLGTTYLGSIGADPRRLIAALKLPTRTFPLVGLLVGHPGQQPQYKPRLPREITTGVDSYPELAAQDDALEAYDRRVGEYYDLRDANNRVDAFSLQIARALGLGAASTAPVREILNDQLLCLR